MLWIVSTSNAMMECLWINNYICPAKLISIMMTSIVSHGPGALVTDPVYYGGAYRFGMYSKTAAATCRSRRRRRSSSRRLHR
jgi:hypothetical protein